MEQFLRTATLTVLENNSTSNIITDLRISFKIERSIESSPNAGEIRVYNLSDSTIEKMKKKDTSITLSAGYAGKEVVFYTGNGLDIETFFDGPNKVTLIKSGDGKEQLSATTVNLKIAQGSDISKVVEDLTSKMKNISFTKIEKVKLLGLGQYFNGGVINGTVKEALDSLLKPLGIDYSIQDSEMKVTTPTETPTSVYSITPLSGLIGTPYKTKEGLRLKVLLNPSIKPHGYVSVVARDINGIYKVLSLSHVGDTHGKEWSTDIEVKTI